ncbi:hypothetical protein NQ317_012900 [Molorchus minor]|uniref:Uncharacterized protein n=1 Tax=Molorchus minor TaxID=1323400 RepID=A0ABQ9JS21_9CUCU|nr:hypothetical protein NQ317_012900 [Molorchus minor]
MGRPFMPFEQLLAVLPAASKDLLPEAYHHLMVDDDSEIKEYYPEDFETDLNGKKQEWEAVVLVPFIDEKVLLEAMEKCKDELTPNLGQYSAPEYFPAIPHNHTFVDTMNYDDVLIPKEKLVKGAYPGVKMDVYYPGFPTMKHLKYKGQLKPAKIKVFETPSRNENMIITIIPNEKFSGGDDTRRSSGVVAISNSKRKYVSMGGPNEYNVEERTGNMIGQFKKEIEGITDFYKKRWGIEVGETSVLVYVRVMIGRKYIFSSNGRLTLEKQFTDNTANYPLQSVVFDIAAYDSQNSTFKDVESIFPKGCMCFTLTNPYYGSQGVVQDSKEPLKNGRIKISISVLEEPDFSSVREMSASIIRSYKSLHSTATISNFIFSKITGSIFITARNNEGGLKNVNIGLDLKFNKKNKETPGYTKKMGNTWFYTNQAVEMVRMYMEKYPEIFHYLYQDTNSDEINAESIFKDDWDEKLKELQTWLKQLPCHSVERQTCGTEIVEPDVIKEIESIVDKCTKSGKSKKVTMQIKPNFLYRPEIQDGTLMPDPKTETKIFDRIVNVRNGYTVPLGLKGTVVAIHKSADGSDRDVIYDVVFDKPFDGGMQLNCSENRGYKLPNTAVVNISYGTRLMEAKTGKPDELIARAEATHSQGNNHNNNKTPNHLYNSPPQQFFQMQPYQQPHPQQSWRQYQNPPQQYVPLQNHQPFQQENSAFAQFCSNNNLASRESFSDPPYNSPMQRQNYGSPFNQPTINTKIESQTHSKQFRNGSSSSNGVVDRASFQFQKSDNMFMPSFGNRRQEGEQATSQSPEKRPNMHKNESFDLTQSSTGVTETDVQANISESSTAPKSPNKTMVFDNKLSEKANTDYLKSLLKIKGKRTSTQSEPSSSNNASVPSSCQKPNDKQVEEKKGDGALFDMFANAAKSPASVRLLTYYQSNGLGLPRYQYFRNGDSIQSQLSLPTGETVVGKPAKNREEASENVAAETLEIFIKKAKGEADTTKQTGDFPSPPQTWVQPAKATTTNNKEQKPERQRTSSKTDTAVLNNSFVPLQAIKNHISKVNTNNKQLPGEGTLTENQDNKTSVSESDNKDYKNQSTSNQNSQRQRRERKTRIAANFVASKNQ